MNDRQFYLTIAGLVLAAFMFRWELEVGGGEGISHKLDRWTGSSYVCLGLNGCTKQED